MLTSFGAIKLRLTLYASILTISLSTAQYQLCMATHIDCTRNVVILMFGKTFSNRVISAWNSLPLTVDFSTLHSFKRSIVQVDFTNFLVCV